jgi:hypothetical protein
MSKRLQVNLPDEEMAALRQLAREQQMSVAELVRQTLREARRRASAQDAERELRAIEQGARHAFPTADIDQMLKEIGSGYLG